MTTCYLHNKNIIEKNELSKALSDAFGVSKEDIFFSDGEKSPNYAHCSVIVEQWKLRESPEDLRVEIILEISDKIFKRNTMGVDENLCHSVDLEAARMIAPHMKQAIVGSYEDVQRDELCFVKCYPDGREERIEWPDEEE